jgi:DNA-directed RNA polymerase specialized sigma24 family protein
VRRLRATYGASLRMKFGMKSDDGEEVIQEGIAKYLTIAARYPAGENHFGILWGVVCRKAYEHLRRNSRAERAKGRLRAHHEANRPHLARGEDPLGSTADRVIRAEDARLIRKTLQSLDDGARTMLLQMADGSPRRRLELINGSGVNKNTFDTRLRRFRLMLRKQLRTAGLFI